MLDTVLLFAILAIVAAHLTYTVHRSRSGERRIHGVVKREFVAEVAKQTEAFRKNKPLIDVLRANPGMSASQAMKIVNGNSVE